MAKEKSFTKKKPEAKKLFLSQIQLKGYKTVLDLTAQFQNGLNIIIGQNGVGKTNFMQATYNSIIDTGRKENSAAESSVVILDGDEKIIIHSNKSNDQVILDNNPNLFRFQREIKIGRRSSKTFDDQLDYLIHLYDAGIQNSISFIRHGIPLKQLNFINTFETWEFNHKGEFSPSSNIYSDGCQFENQIMRKALIRSRTQNKDFVIDETNYKIFATDFIDGMFNELQELTPTLRRFSNITAIHSNRNVNVYYDKDHRRTIINNLQLEFEINKSILPFSALSDGTKRLLYIILEVAHKSFLTTPPNRIILIEEPELGLHPFQLSKLLDFIREQSHNKQIILTTHAPQVLDILDSNELDRLSIAYFDPEKQTQMRKLTDAEISKAKKYIEQHGHLSDYWRLSDLEKN